MRASTTIFAITALLASTAQAQIPGLSSGLISGLSTNCLGGLASLLSNQDLNSCLAITSVITELGTVGQNDSLVGPLNTYIGSNLCPASPCSNSTLASANSTINQSCSSEIQSGANVLPGLLQLVVSNYNDVKKASCYEDTKANNEICIVQTLTNLQQNLGQNVSLNTITSLSKGGSSALQPLLSKLAANSSALCTDCNRGILTTLAPTLQSYLNSSTNQALQQAVAQGCGQTFLTSGVPTDLKETGKLQTTSGSNSGTNGASLVTVSSVTAGTALLAIGMALLA
ncbi:uncharacterized protein FA14DRAFT_178697 [Meira miltonrushii]|uniref:GPI-anchored protein n=1 Tax=Meira miltonrushii TaxID=1280837 RepID=A0A316VH44_9BASI|nr:uncharacterized protein FA14DRAFT_178697 [Meira miltonrushii]PWN35321.1 hypothetical protein FA14DRAFT_178697 [Meira miltonrushii]